jgi:hypothetical protein
MSWGCECETRSSVVPRSRNLAQDTPSPNYKYRYCGSTEYTSTMCLDVVLDSSVEVRNRHSKFIIRPACCPPSIRGYQWNDIRLYHFLTKILRSLFSSSEDREKPGCTWRTWYLLLLKTNLFFLHSEPLLDDKQ